ncbi:hypothetical protein F5Y17DRAFT_474659 [Xylariaceae sp. FL0594]|nr:hypothetical protein F5Y17DRAFT_474659 [Xylariaceae sp. FL0594]
MFLIRHCDGSTSKGELLPTRSGGYPLNQAPYSALGPVIGQFLLISIPPSWAADRSEEILQARQASFGLRPDECDSFPGRFTTGSTMGNRIGLHTALAQHPGDFVYFTSHTHYSVKKTVQDCDVLTGIWTDDLNPRLLTDMVT